jgi:predicted regulator of Ras-like GTPase activity (Roadblock/LC7/MglB family)
MQGSLRDMSVADLIQHTCQDGRTARLTLEGPGGSARLYIAGGQVMHAEMGEADGEDVVFQLIEWQDGSFQLEPDVAAPRQTIQRTVTGLLLEGARLADEKNRTRAPADESVADLLEPVAPIKEGGMSAVVEALSRIEGVTGVVLVAEDGVVIASKVDGDPEKEGAVAAFVGGAAQQAGEALALGAFKRAIATMGSGNVLVLKHADYYAGLVLADNASSALVASRAEAALAGAG